MRKEYSSAVFYAEDAFAGLHVMTDLTAEDGARERRVAEGKTVKIYARPASASVTVAEPAIPEPAFPGRSPAIQPSPDIPQPPFYGVRVKHFDLDQVFAYVNETALFKNQWQLKTASATDYLRLVDEKYRPVLRELMAEVKAKQWFMPQAVYGFFPASADGNDLVVYEPPPETQTATPTNGRLVRSELRERLRITFPRQREGRRLSIADFFEPADGANVDVVGFSVVTIGSRASEETKKLFEGGDFTRYLYAHGLSVETAEALAELTHKHIREELGIAGLDAGEVKDLFHQKYRGSRYSFGYAACPNLEDQRKIFDLLEPEKNIGVQLTEQFHLEPEQSTNALIVHHPQAKYFMV